MTELKRYGAYVGAPIHDDTSVYLCEDVDALLSERDRRERELRSALTKINYIRNSIVAMQKVNFSEHVYPLVAALDEAGFEGMDYPQALDYFGSMLERTRTAEDKAAAAESELATLRQQLREVTEWRPMETAPEGNFLLLEKFGTIRIARLFRHGGSVLDDFAHEVGWLPLPPLPKEVER
jgi:hypothetical protein